MNSKSNKTIGLEAIAGCDNDDRQGDVVFVHGLGGSFRSTWHPQERSDDNDFWLTWLWQELPELGVWSYGYEAEPSQWKGSAMPLRAQASNLLDWLEVRELGAKPLCFVAHSMGGLLVNKLLSAAQNFKRSELLNQIKGVVFLATPHAGSDLADAITKMSWLTRTTVSVDELKAHAPQLSDLNEWYRQHAVDLGISTKVFYETKPVKGILVVDADSANPGMSDVKPVAIPKNHIDIVKPDSKNDLVFLGVARFLSSCLSPTSEKASVEISAPDIVVSSLNGSRRLSPLKGHLILKLEDEESEVFTEGFRASFSLNHNQIGTALIKVRAVVLKVIEFVPNEIPKYRYKVNFDELKGHQIAETKVFNVLLNGDQPPSSVWARDNQNPLSSETGNLLDVEPPCTLTLTGSVEESRRRT